MEHLDVADIGDHGSHERGLPPGHQPGAQDGSHLVEQETAPGEVVELASRRQDARGRGEYEEADRLREQVEAAGWQVRDRPDGFDLVPL